MGHDEISAVSDSDRILGVRELIQSGVEYLGKCQMSGIYSEK